MGASEILSLLRQSCLSVSMEAGRLIVRPAEQLTDQTRGLIRENKPGILAALELEAEELTRLVRECGEAYGFTEEEHREALAIALNDPECALACYRSIAREINA